MLHDNLVRHDGQHIGVVIAATFEQATYAADLVRIAYEEEPAATSVEAALAHAFPVTEGNEGSGTPAAYRRGHPDRALADAPVTVDHTYVIARENHNPIELHATIAEWDGDRLTLYDKTQWPGNVASNVALVFGIPEENVRVVSPFVGGAFGSALRTWPHVVLAAMAARQVGRPVKIVLTRRQMYTSVGCRPYTIQRVALGAERDGRLRATIHDATAETSCYEEYTEQLLDTTWALYRCANLATLYRLVRLNVHTPTPMRAPGHVSGIFALECAMDELAVELGMDPSSCACATTRSAIRRKICPDRASRCARATGSPANGSAGSGATPSRVRCARTVISSATAWRRPTTRRGAHRPRRARASSPTAARSCAARPATWGPAPTPR